MPHRLMLKRTDLSVAPYSGHALIPGFTAQFTWRSFTSGVSVDFARYYAVRDFLAACSGLHVLSLPPVHFARPSLRSTRYMPRAA